MIPQRVSLLRSRAVPLQVAAAAHLAGRYDQCLDIVSGKTDAAALALSARSLIRLNRHGDALRDIEAALALKPSVERLAEMLSLKATALACLGRFSEGDVAIGDARFAAAQSEWSVIKAETEYASAVLHWFQRRFGAMDKDLQRLLALPLESSAAGARLPSEDYVATLSGVRAKAYDVLGARAAVLENYEEQATLVAMAFEELDGGSTIDRHFESKLLLNYAVLARDLDLPGSHEFVSSRVQTLDFSPYMKLEEFHIRRALGWCEAGRGNFLGAFREFRQSADAAPSTPWRIVSILDRVLLARELHKERSAREDLGYAVFLSESVDWQATQNEESTALVVLAQQLASQDAALARDVLDRYEGVKTPLPGTSIAAVDRRMFADLRYANAHVLRAEGNLTAATAAFEECYAIWTQIGYVSRAAHAAADLAGLTQNGHYISAAIREAARKPVAWSSARLAAAA